MTTTPLTDETSAAALGANAAKWLAAGLSTAPADRAAAADAVRLAYRCAGLPEPAHVVWFASPAAGARAAALLTGRRDLPGPLPERPMTTAARRAARAGLTLPTARLGVTTTEAAGDLAVAEELRAQGCPPVPGTAGVSVRAQVRTTPWAAARAEVHELLGPDGWARLWAACGADVWRMVNDRVATPLRTHLRNELPTHVRAVLLDAVGGQHDAGWLAAFDAAASRADHSRGETPAAVLAAAQRLAGLAGLARSAGWWWPYANVAILTDRPDELHRDNVGRLHAAQTPALHYSDGFALHAWRGMPIPSDLVDRLAHLTHAQIAAERNAELRRVMLEHFGYERYLREAGARRLGADACGVLWQLTFADDEPLTMVEVVNSTPEPDGTSRVYWLRVPPTTRTPRAGVAWTFGLTEEEYQPLVQT
ncbi:hypothetical protein Daura_41180 [Dactylosporangium aurantiacum]|uniref:DUF6745 domain-containing protein n=1 Tax=Dactylosporangium aurantiacum TaxID=35754 RepID=A0A9Q9IEB1_9ACTN|nr:hypothetical protein [Dactylosporangium aurantiacum]MDG6102806.1 hypothetical protein [Dactylosporangium aurantiacum]UWZ52953.1 hypothetical protein Daura_41180 [Dactylosporangium aurantiacum]